MRNQFYYLGFVNNYTKNLIIFLNLMGQNFVARHQNTVFWIIRRAVDGPAKDMRPVERPGFSPPWEGQLCRAILGHKGREVGSGHWVAFLLVGGVWWLCDTSVVQPIRLDPFVCQAHPGRADMGDLTIDILFFSQ